MFHRRIKIALEKKGAEEIIFTTSGVGPNEKR